MSERNWTDEEAIAHGRKWPTWVWKRGQIAVLPDGRRPVVVRVDDGGVPWGAPGAGGLSLLGAAPDMRDPGTRGHALAQVREAWDNPRLFVEWVGCGWRVMGGTLDGVSLTESESLLAARRAAP